MDGLEEVGGGDPFGSGEVGDGPGDAEDAVIGAGGEAEFFHRLLEEVALRPFEGAGFAEFAATEQGVAAAGPPAEPPALKGAGGLDPGAHGRRG